MTVGYQARSAPGVTILGYPGQRHEELLGWRASTHSLVFYLGVRIGEMAVESDRLRPQRWSPYTILYRPPGVDYVHNCLQAADFIEIRYTDELHRQLRRAGLAPFVPVGGRAAPRLVQHAKSLNGLLYGAHGEDPLAVESEAFRFLQAACEVFGGRSTSGAHEGRRLDSIRLCRTLGTIEARLSDKLGLAELAAAVDLNVHHFAKAFRATTGSTPHQHITSRRLSRARAMLEGSDVDLVDVALACGFSSQSHMTELFRRHVGTTPGRYRRAVSGA